MKKSLIIVILFLVFQGNASEMNKEKNCVLETLGHLGWKIDDTTDSLVPFREDYMNVSSGHACDDDTISQSHKKGEMKLSINLRYFKAAKDRKYFDEVKSLLYNRVSMCGYMHKINEATKKAVKALDGNANYAMGDLAVSCSTGKKQTMQYFPSFRASELVGCFYNQNVSTECQVAQEVAGWSIQYELYGKRHFDLAFEVEELGLSQNLPDEVVNPQLKELVTLIFQNPLNRRDNLTLVDQSGVKRASLGHMAFVGQRGVIINSMQELKSDLFDSPADKAENFIVVSVTKDAARAIKNDGIARYAL